MKVLVTGATSLLGGAVAARLAARGDDVTVFQRATERPAVPRGARRRRRPRRGRRGGRRRRRRDPRRGEGRGRRAVVRRSRPPTSPAPRTCSTRPAPPASAGSCTSRRRRSPTPGTSLVGEPGRAGRSRPARGQLLAQQGAAPSCSALAADTDDFSVVAVRPHLVWGPGDTQLIGRIVDRARQGRLAVIGSGAALIDTTYIDNAADAIVAAADRAGELGGRAFVVSNGQPRPVRELLDGIATAAGLRAAAAARPGRPSPRRAGTRPRTGVGPPPPRGRPADHELPGRAAVDRALVRPARDPAGARMASRPSDLDEGFARLAAWFGTARDRTALPVGRCRRGRYSSVTVAGIDERT